MFKRSYFGIFSLQHLWIVYFSKICLRDVTIGFWYFNILELFVFLKYAKVELFWHLRILTSSICLFCFNIFKRNYFDIFVFQHLYVVKICLREVIMPSLYFNIFELCVLLKYVLEKLFGELRILTYSNCLFYLNVVKGSYFDIFAFQHLGIVHFC